ncbi:sporulation integral membrane protein YtvI [Neobacillus piezotolerans]|uniref:Sporulation integral membrane protein YtvI n=1 Tax=Neobacillus piezotolerans TaxID=2259171 RepID=A0A3D8GWA1_9BACI|nr:sporulation integral membrane protein YtvI [Neobacillus piezotolerans]RDU38451.1 sporulation integral membrane protein YtvI [Neobacillus piezotolerans]
MTAYFSKKRIAWLVGIAAAAIALYFILPVSIPLIMALITAILLEPAVRLAGVKLKLKRNQSVLAVFSLFVLIAASVGYYVATKAITEAIIAVNHMPVFVNKLSAFWFEAKQAIARAAKDLPDAIVIQLTGQLDKFIDTIKNVLLAYVNIGNIRALLTNVPNLLISFLVYLVALFLFMIDIPRLRLGLHKHLSERTAEKVNLMFSRLSYIILGFLKAQLLVSILIFAISLLGLYLIVPEAAVFAAFIIWLFDFIPIIGSIIVLGPWAIFAALMGNTLLAIELSALAAVLITTRHYLEPKMLGSHFRLSPLLTLAAMYLGFKILGLTGIVLGPILVVAISSAREAGILKFNYKI